ncbi:MAG: ATP-binding protein [Candidatus Theseobacter exili]|nr:ATP-binding protein [Candidatus Theseobacter exili]
MKSLKDSNVHLQIPTNEFFLCVARNVVTSLAERCGFSELDTHKIEMAVDEACANVIEHSYSDNKSVHLQSEKGIEIDVCYDCEKISVEIMDRGKKMKHESNGTFSLDEHVENMNGSGLGLYIIHNFMYKVDYVTDKKGQNHLIMIKYINK